MRDIKLTPMVGYTYGPKGKTQPWQWSKLETRTRWSEEPPPRFNRVNQNNTQTQKPTHQTQQSNPERLNRKQPFFIHSGGFELPNNDSRSFTTSPKNWDPWQWIGKLRLYNFNGMVWVELCGNLSMQCSKISFTAMLRMLRKSGGSFTVEHLSWRKVPN